MSWILKGIYSFVTGSPNDEDDDDDGQRSEQELKLEEAKAAITGLISANLKYAEDFESASPRPISIVYAIVDNNEWSVCSGNYVGLSNGKTRLFVRLPLRHYTSIAFGRNFLTGEVVKSTVSDEWKISIRQLSDQTLKPHGQSISQPVLVNEKYSVIALVLREDVMKRLSEDLEDCGDVDRICSNADYTLEYKRTEEVRLHLNVPINVATDCWWKLPPLEMPKICSYADNVVQPRIDDIASGLRENAGKLGWSKSRISKIKF